MHFLILKISFPSVYVAGLTAVYEGASRTDVTVTFLNKTWPAAQWRIGGQHLKIRHLL